MINFYNANSNRRYPFAATATLTDADGVVLPNGLIADLCLSADLIYGNKFFVSAVTKKNSACSVVISSYESMIPLAVATVDSNDLRFRYGKSASVHVSPILDSAISGVIVFGEKFAELGDCIRRFDNHNATLIHPRAIFPVSVPSNQRWAVFRSNELLVGDVVISQDGDIEVVFEDRYLGGKTVKAMIFRLAGVTSEVLAEYSLNEGRAESNTCKGRQIITINGVQPDCCGRIFFEFRGCAVPTRIINHCGVVLECDLAIGEICPAPVDYSGTTTADPTECAPVASQTNTGVSTAGTQADAPRNII